MLFSRVGKIELNQNLIESQSLENRSMSDSCEVIFENKIFSLIFGIDIAKNKAVIFCLD